MISTGSVYEIVKTNPLVEREAVQGNGGLCGGIFLDEAFIDPLKGKIDDAAWKWLPSDEFKKMRNGDGERGIKKQSEGQEKDWPVELPVEHNASNALHLQYVLLVGGSGRCQYLGVRLQSSVGTGIELRQPQGHKYWNAFCHGAVIPGLNRRSSSVGFFWFVMRQKFMAGNQTDWFIKVEKKSRRRYVQHSMSPVDEIACVLYYSSATPVPGRGGKTVRELCRITWTKRIDIRSLPSVINNIGVTYYELHFEVEMSADGTSLDFTVIYDRKPVGAKNASVCFEPQGREAGRIV
ncbi:hsp70 family chaperone [Colletotrichum incanum]|nr:hsp70 family chaperone [Colletotrichum incanum]